jgi:hypothetical protein
MAAKETSWDKVKSDAVAPEKEPKPPTPNPIFQDWVMCLGLRLQGVLVSAIRGCDTVQRHDNSKVLTRIYRSEILRTHGTDPKKSKSFIMVADIPETVKYMTELLNDCDHLPQHYVMHFLHAAEILGYTHPDYERRDMWNSFYLVACRKYHLRPEPYSEMVDRLEKEEDEFHKNQDTTVTPKLYNERQIAEKAKHQRVHGQYGGS